eukprot:TRINITY_DN24561_c0_g1_i4.p1 TRINITY_DN24561_c0_g1~~TRINITY_DN24561_c0_g1_i4.p1  ORF type:complete len:116 (-),score=25.78 TRINITY_DN24561_c0_g1_i4:64-411(-)
MQRGLVGSEMCIRDSPSIAKKCIRASIPPIISREKLEFLPPVVENYSSKVINFDPHPESFGTNLFEPTIPKLNPVLNGDISNNIINFSNIQFESCLLYTSPSPRDLSTSRMPSSA